MHGIDTSLTSEVIVNADRIGDIDVVVGLPTYNVEETVANVICCGAEGLNKFLPQQKGLIAVSDGNSQDRSIEVASNSAIPEAVELLTFKYQGIPGKGSALRGIFELADRLGARAVVVVDADLKSITPEWINLLAGRILSGEFDLITPLYERHRFDGTITKALCYPLTRALYGLRIRQPIGGDFGLSRMLVNTLLKIGDWQSDIARFGIDIWLTTTAICEGFRIAQAHLGTKDHAHKDPACDLHAMFGQVVGTLFSLMEKYEDRWQRLRGSHAVEIFGESPKVQYHPVDIDQGCLISEFQKGLKEYGELWKEVFGLTLYSQIKGLRRLKEDEFVFPVHLWVKSIYNLAGAFKKGQCEREELLRSLLPLYFGRTAGFKNEVLTETDCGVEMSLELQALGFETMKPYLVEKWNSGTQNS